MKYVVVTLALTLIAVSWFAFNRYLSVAEKRVIAAENTAPPVADSPRSTAPVELSPEASSEVPSRLSAAEKPDEPAATPSTREAPRTVPIDLGQTLGPDNLYFDAMVGLSVKLPAGWTVRNALRWGPGLRENTVFMQPEVRSTAIPTMYYKPYTPEEGQSLYGSGAQSLLREQALKKEASRAAGTPDYQNVADSFTFFDVNGSPAMSYFATFSRGNQVMTEHFIRILGPRGYVMFFTKGTFEDVKAVMPQLNQAATTVRGP